jgi:hypothetical protein
MEANRISDGGRRALRVFCIAICDVPERTNAGEVLRTAATQIFQRARQFRDPNKWWRAAAARVACRPGCSVAVDAGVEAVYGSWDGSRAHGVVVDGRREPADRVVLCTQSTGLKAVVAGTPFENNWPIMSGPGDWVRETSYGCFGFQLHFTAPVKGPRGGWCWTCTGAWTVIALPASDWLADPSRDPSVREVWSCCVVDTQAPAERGGGRYSADDLRDPRAVVRECLAQMREAAPPSVAIEPAAVSLSPGLHHDGTRWVSARTGFSAGARGRLPFKGRAENLFAVGCFSESPAPTVSQFGVAVGAALRFCEAHGESAGAEKAGFEARPSIPAAAKTLAGLAALALVTYWANLYYSSESG